MLFKPGTPAYSYEIVKEEGAQVMYVNFLGANVIPNLVEEEVMERTVDLLVNSSGVSRIVFVQQRNYSYDSDAVFKLQEIADLYIYLTKQENILSTKKISILGLNYISQRYNEVNSLLIKLKRDPVGCFHDLKIVLRRQKELLKTFPENVKIDLLNYIGILQDFYNLLGNTKLVKQAEERAEDYSPNSRNIYNFLFEADIIPNFTFTRLVAGLPGDSRIVKQYEIGDKYEKSTVTILKNESETKYFYHVMPPEYSLTEDKQGLLNLARNVMVEHQPKAEEFTDPERTRQVFFNVARDLIRELSETKKVKLTYAELNTLASILVRHTIGFGLIEILLQDENIQDIVLNAPISANPVYLRHQEFDECFTNVLPSREDGDSWAAKFRMMSGRPLDEANPILDTDMSLGNMSARVAVIQKPLSPTGVAYAFRRHRDNPWTLPLFVKYKMLNSFAAGMFSFIIDGNRTMLIAGTRSSGKTSLLGSLMLEIMPKYRTIVIEDTLELPVDALRKLKYDILRMKVRSSLLKESAEVGADEGIRTSLRLGDSSLIVGEVRSLEAQALYEAMRVGALANVVAGTIHGASPYGVFDRVVNDLKVPLTSFKATDCIIVANPVKTPDGMKSMKRVIQLTEVRKHWNTDPEMEGGFVDLLKYDVEKDELKPTEELMNGDSEMIKSIAGGIKGWAGNWDAVYDNILLRGKIKQALVDMSLQIKNQDILEAEFNHLSNNMFHEISAKVREEVGLPVSEKVFPLWQDWLKKEINKRKL